MTFLSSYVHDVHVENIINQQVGLRVAQMRAEAEITQADLGRAMSARLGRDIRPVTITRLEGGKRPIGVDELVAAAAALNVAPADLLTDNDMPVRAARAMGAGEVLNRAEDELFAAVREWTRAHNRLRQQLDDAKVIEALPTMQEVWLSTLARRTFADVIADAQKKAQSAGTSGGQYTIDGSVDVDDEA